MNKPERIILHIRPEPAGDESACGIEKFLAESPRRVSTCGDVYRGLARIGLSAADAFAAVVVCLDGVGPAEMEFFSLVARMRPGLDVYVYGGGRSKVEVARAIELGAKGEASETVIRALDASPLDQPVDEAARVAAGARETLDDDNYGTAVRVPWLRYTGGPARAAPPRRKPPQKRQEAAQAAGSRSSPAEPLLTDEEVKALIGDDISTIAPEERSIRDADGCREREDLP